MSSASRRRETKASNDAGGTAGSALTEFFRNQKRPKVVMVDIPVDDDDDDDDDGTDLESGAGPSTAIPIEVSDDSPPAKPVAPRDSDPLPPARLGDDDSVTPATGTSQPSALRAVKRRLVDSADGSIRRAKRVNASTSRRTRAPLKDIDLDNDGSSTAGSRRIASSEDEDFDPASLSRQKAAAEKKARTQRKGTQALAKERQRRGGSKAAVSSSAAKPEEQQQRSSPTPPLQQAEDRNDADLRGRSRVSKAARRPMPKSAKKSKSSSEAVSDFAEAAPAGEPTGKTSPQKRKAKAGGLSVLAMMSKGRAKKQRIQDQPQSTAVEQLGWSDIDEGGNTGKDQLGAWQQLIEQTSSLPAFSSSQSAHGSLPDFHPYDRYREEQQRLARLCRTTTDVSALQRQYAALLKSFQPESKQRDGKIRDLTMSPDMTLPRTEERRRSELRRPKPFVVSDDESSDDVTVQNSKNIDAHLLLTNSRRKQSPAKLQESKTEDGAQESIYLLSEVPETQCPHPPIGTTEVQEDSHEPTCLQQAMLPSPTPRERGTTSHGATDHPSARSPSRPASDLPVATNNVSSEHLRQPVTPLRACPICQVSYPADELEEHASRCSTRSSREPSPLLRPRRRASASSRLGECPYCGKKMTVSRLQDHIDCMHGSDDDAEEANEDDGSVAWSKKRRDKRQPQMKSKRRSSSPALVSPIRSSVASSTAAVGAVASPPKSSTKDDDLWENWGVDNHPGSSKQALSGNEAVANGLSNLEETDDAASSGDESNLHSGQPSSTSLLKNLGSTRARPILSRTRKPLPSSRKMTAGRLMPLKLQSTSSSTSTRGHVTKVRSPSLENHPSRRLSVEHLPEQDAMAAVQDILDEASSPGGGSGSGGGGDDDVMIINEDDDYGHDDFDDDHDGAAASPQIVDDGASGDLDREYDSDGIPLSPLQHHVPINDVAASDGFDYGRLFTAAQRASKAQALMNRRASTTTASGRGSTGGKSSRKSGSSKSRRGWSWRGRGRGGRGRGRRTSSSTARRRK